MNELLECIQESITILNKRVEFYLTEKDITEHCKIIIARATEINKKYGKLIVNCTDITKDVKRA